MGLKSKESFYKHCILEVDRQTQFEDLCWDILLKGIAQVHSTRGHAIQAIGATQRFFESFPNHRVTIQNAPIAPFEIANHPTILNDWLRWLSPRTGPFSLRFGYDYDTLRTYLTPALGGVPYQPGHPQGGRGDNEFKIVLRLMAEFYGRS
jgi:hypothetical protein